MRKIYNRVCARIDLDAVEYNIRMMKKNVREETGMIAVVKADGYGHGAVYIARMLEEENLVWGFAVATLDEAAALKRQGIKKPILVLGCIFPDQYAQMLEYDIRMTVYTEEMAAVVSSLAVQKGKEARVHIKLDTGMSRIGFPASEESVGKIEVISRMPGLVVEGMYTHFARADETDKAFTEKQLARYQDVRQALKARGIEIPFCHCSNSAGIIDVPEANMDLVRAGISTYGLYPSEEVKKGRVPLKPALELISHVAHVKWTEAGTPVSYGGTYVTEKPACLATIPVGYGDGYPRSLSNKGYVLIHGKKAPVRGRVCMDQFMVDVTDIPDVKFGDRVVLTGKDGAEELPVETLSELSGRFNYEFVCDLGKRIPREYIRHGEIIGQKDYFE